MNLNEKLCIIMSSIEISAAKQREIFEKCDLSLLSTEFIENSGAAKILSKNDFSRLAQCLNKIYFDDILSQFGKYNVVPVTYYSPEYPENLKFISEPPMTLYCRGNIELLKKTSIAVVGTRKASAYGRRVTSHFTKELAAQFVIVSGLAYGVDTVAHETTLAVGGQTIAVLGSGVLNIYPAANENLAKQIVDDGGLIVSEFGLFAQPNSYHFPMRNRIVAGLSKAILITEAPLKSGTMSTLEFALEQGKDVFAVPGEIYSQNSQGCNEVLKRLQGALVTDPKDILQSLNVKYGEKQKKTIQLDFNEQLVVNCLSLGKQSFDELIVATKLSPSTLTYVLASLELSGCVVRLPSNFYQYMEE